MKLNVMFTIAAVVMILFGILSFFAPPALRGTDPSAAFSSKIIGVVLLSLGVMAWSVRNAEPSKTRDSGRPGLHLAICSVGRRQCIWFIPR